MAVPPVAFMVSWTAARPSPVANRKKGSESAVPAARAQGATARQQAAARAGQRSLINFSIRTSRQGYLEMNW
jgi:hypothetical protein